MNYITKTISRENLILKEYDSDSTVSSYVNSKEQVSERDFLVAAVELLALISIEAIISANDQ
jgi:hypothetical protein